MPALYIFSAETKDHKFTCWVIKMEIQITVKPPI